MDASELNRKLLYCGYSDVTDYLKRCPVNRFIYKRLIELLPKAEIDLQAVTVFNEVYYQCARIQYDHNPGVDIQKRYLEESASWLNSVGASELVFCLVYAFLKRKRQYSFAEECFKESLRPLLDGCIYLGLSKDLVHFMEQNNIIAPDEFETMPCPVYQIPEKVGNEYYYTRHPLRDRIKKYFGQIVIPESIVINPWAEVTDNYSFSVMESYIKLYSTKDEQLELLKRIDNSCTGIARKDHNSDLLNLKVSIEDGEYERPVSVLDALYDSQEEYDRMFAAGYSQTMEEAENDKAEQYKQERDTIKYQLEQLKKNYEEDLSRLETQYKEEIEKLKDELNQKSQEQAKVEVKDTAHPKELTFTVSEIVDDAKKWFHESGAIEISNMLYRLPREHKYLDDDLWDMIGSISPAVEKRIAPHTQIDIPTAHQVNIGPGQVINKTSEEQEKK